MKIRLDGVKVQHSHWELSADCSFCEGTHLVNGPVGSGKSTLALVMAGILLPTLGTIYRDQISSCMLSLQFPEYHITGSTLAEECSSWGLNPSSVLEMEGLENKRDDDPLSLSRGELKRLHLACVLQNQYDLLLLDEPFSALDCQQKESLCTRLSGRPAGITVILTHERRTLPMIDRFWEIRGGLLTDMGAQHPVYFNTVCCDQNRKNRVDEA